MNTHILTYYWKNGMPCGISPVNQPDTAPMSYSISHDPYHKRIVIEKYHKGVFSGVVYDSKLFDFRDLKKTFHESILRETLREGENEQKCLIRDEHHCPILIECHLFESHRPRKCIYQDPLSSEAIAIQYVYYEDLGDPFNGVQLTDVEGIVVMEKHYEIEEGQFTRLLFENWTISDTAASSGSSLQ